jgi:hypothetical protein
MELLLHAWAAERHRQLFVSVATLADHHPVYRAAETSVYVYAQLYVYMMCDQFVQTDVQTNVRTDQCTYRPMYQHASLQQSMGPISASCHHLQIAACARSKCVPLCVNWYWSNRLKSARMML